MTKDDILYIFRTFWPEKGFDGIHPYLPGWSKARASNFAARNGIRMTDEARRAKYESMVDDKIINYKPKAKQETAVSHENKLLRMKW